ncbi:hypothetical protein Q9S36_34455, partial [Microbacterium sp. ARD31]|uniref:hypothetical protein n=1 Tax=Microbacterium sp. ARD31 TaxID=2962576 RepID=UPI002882C35F
LHGLSQVLGEEFPRLFSKKGAARGALSSAFPLATLMFGKSLDQMPQLDELFPVLPDGSLDVQEFEKALFASTKFVDDCLSRYLAFEFVSDGDSLAHGELQIVSMIAAAAAHAYDFRSNFSLRGTSASRKKAQGLLKVALPQHYIYDILRSHWRGSLYTYAFQRVWDGVKPSKAYLEAIDAGSFDSALKTLFSEQMTDVSHKRKNITAADRAFLKFLYSSKVKVADQKSNKFDVEHLIPVARIQKMTSGKEPWALGALGNLAVLPAGPNRIKRDETVAQYLARSGKSAPTREVATLVKSLLFVPVSDVAIPQRGKVDIMTQAQYDAFVRKNWNAMRAQLKKSVGIK